MIYYVKKLNFNDNAARLMALEKLQKLKSRIPIKQLLKILATDKSDYIVKNVWWTLKSLGATQGQIVKAHLEAVRRSLPIITIEFHIEALGDFGDTSAVESLIEIFQCGDYTLRSSAAKALGKIGDKRAIKPLLGSLWTCFATLDSDYEYEQVMESLKKLGATKNELVSANIKALLSSDRKSVLRAIKSFGDIEDASATQFAVPPLIAIINNNETLLYEAVKSALLYENDTVSDSSPRGVHFSNETLLEMRCLAAESLGKIGDKRAIEPLRKALENDSSWLRATIEKTLTTFEAI